MVVSFKNLAGLMILIFGLTMFARGPSIGLMPLSEIVGRELPGKMPSSVVLFVIFCLGVLCTIAEPSIQALQTAGEKVDFNNAPYVKIVLSAAYRNKPGAPPENWVVILTLFVGLGVK